MKTVVWARPATEAAEDFDTCMGIDSNIYVCETFVISVKQQADN